MMRIKILPPPGADRSALDARGWASLPEGARLKDALKLVRCSRLRARLLLISVNGERVPLDTPLSDGDVIGFFSLVSGG